MPDNKIYGTSGNNVLTGTDSTTERDMIYGYGGSDELSGGGGNDVLYGGAGSDTLYGGDGDDQLTGGEGGDTMYGGAGNDTYYVDSIDDQVFEMSNEGLDTVVSFLANYRIGANIEQLFIGEGAAVDAAGRSNGAGNDLNNAMKGNSGSNILNGGAGNDSIYGYGGDDFLIGGLGNDKMVGGAGIDTVSFKEAANGVFVDLTRTNTYNTGVGMDQILEVENIEGSEFADVLMGNGGVNKIVGRGGGDQIRSMGGDDYLVGGTGADEFYFEAAAVNGLDRIADFVSGADKLVFRGSDGYAGATLTYNTGAGPAVATTTGPEFIYNTTKQTLYFDADGDGAGAAIQIASLNENPPVVLQMADIMII